MNFNSKLWFSFDHSREGAAKNYGVSLAIPFLHFSAACIGYVYPKGCVSTYCLPRKCHCQTHYGLPPSFRNHLAISAKHNTCIYQIILIAIGVVLLILYFSSFLVLAMAEPAQPPPFKRQTKERQGQLILISGSKQK